ncbi:MAG: hypothetical protein HY344_02595 [Candidatus Levybacteria bacterium]|nr:hypothetical protein [Candidatus Levybacteria bacterium]
MKAINILIAFALLLIYLTIVNTVSAATFTFSGAPTTLNETDTFFVNINLEINNSSGNVYYIKGVFSHSDPPPSYLGYTKNNFGEWHNDDEGDKAKYYQVTMDPNGQWSGSIEFKLDTQDASFKGSGNYSFKLGRYTATGIDPKWCTEESTACEPVIIAVVAPTPTLTPSPTNSPTPTQTLTPTKSPTPTPTIKPTSTVTPLPTPSKTPTPALSTTTTVTPPTSYSTPALDQSVLGDMDKPDEDKGVVTYVEGASSDNKIGVIFIALGVFFSPFVV